VCPLHTEAADLIGTDFLTKYGAIMDLHHNKIDFAGDKSTPRMCNKTSAECTALTIFTRGKEEHSPQPSPQRTRRKDGQFPAGPPRERDPVQNRMWLVKAKENITLAPRCQPVVLAKLEFQKEREPPSLVCIEPAKIPVEGIFPARALTRVGTNVLESSHATARADRAETGCSKDRAYVMLANFSEETMTVPKATILGMAEVSEQ
jgi:hypothetical protein